MQLISSLQNHSSPLTFNIHNLFCNLIFLENHITELRHERGRKLWFDTSEVSTDSTLMMSELRIFQNPSLGRWQDINKEFVITIYFVTDNEG